MLPMFNGYIDVIVVILMIVFSSAFHEMAHAWAAYLCGDDTAKNMGRISLNPMVHISPVDSILLPGFIYVITQGRFIFGGAKPVPIIVEKLRNPDRDMALTAAAGPLSNFLLVIISTIIFFLSKAITPPPSISYFIINFIILNLILAIFNLIPIAPLDGSRILRYLIPQLRDLYDSMDQWGIAILIGILVLFPGFLSFIHLIIVTIVNSIIVFYRRIPW